MLAELTRDQLKSIIRDVVTSVLKQEKPPIPIGASNRHIHLTAEDYYALFGNEPFENVKTKSDAGHGCCSKKKSATKAPSQADALEDKSVVNLTASRVLSKTDRGRLQKISMTWGDYLASLKDEDYIKVRKISKFVEYI